MKKIGLLIENFWKGPRFFAGVSLWGRLYYCGWLIKTKINEAINYFRDEASGYL